MPKEDILEDKYEGRIKREIKERRRGQMKKTKTDEDCFFLTQWQLQLPHKWLVMCCNCISRV
jgi:hypothetical protein